MQNLQIQALIILRVENHSKLWFNAVYILQSRSHNVKLSLGFLIFKLISIKNNS